jgi:nucleoside-diphosphate-sugar epimerase
MKYLITGGAGFIGSNIAHELLKKGAQVRIIDNFSTGRRINISDIEDKIEVIDGQRGDRRGGLCFASGGPAIRAPVGKKSTDVQFGQYRRHTQPAGSG